MIFISSTRHLSADHAAVHRSVGGQNSPHQALVQRVHLFDVATAFATDSQKLLLDHSLKSTAQYEYALKMSIALCIQHTTTQPPTHTYTDLIEFQVELAIDVDQGSFQLVGSHEIAGWAGRSFPQAFATRENDSLLSPRAIEEVLYAATLQFGLVNFPYHCLKFKYVCTR